MRKEAANLDPFIKICQNLLMDFTMFIKQQLKAQTYLRIDSVIDLE